MNITIKINTENSAFEENAQVEVARILKITAEKIDVHGLNDIGLFDGNGNRCGSIRVTA